MEQATYEKELGKAMCDRLGLVHNSTSTEWKLTQVGNQFQVSMTTVAFITKEEYEDLCGIAVQRAQQQAPTQKQIEGETKP